VHLTVVAVGRLRPAFREAADEYLRRLRRYAPAAEIEVREAGKAPTPAEARRQEGARLQERLPRAALVVALDRQGKAWSSEELAERLDGWRSGARPLALVVGGSHGLDPALLRASHERWSLGPATLPHELARVVAYEQLYRGWTILRGEPYHK
jgi:23S rRNA (pseudouridine1915-N3)-methyltransferase